MSAGYWHTSPVMPAGKKNQHPKLCQLWKSKLRRWHRFPRPPQCPRQSKPPARTASRMLRSLLRRPCHLQPHPQWMGLASSHRHRSKRKLWTFRHRHVDHEGIDFQCCGLICLLAKLRFVVIPHEFSGAIPVPMRAHNKHHVHNTMKYALLALAASVIAGGLVSCASKAPPPPPPAPAPIQVSK